MGLVRVGVTGATALFNFEQQLHALVNHKAALQMF